MTLEISRVGAGTGSAAMIFAQAAKCLGNVGRSFSWAWLDTVCRYRRSKIGPIWETINILFLVGGMTVVSSAVIGGRPAQNLPYIGLGMIIWTAISALVNEGTGTFLVNAAYITGSTMPVDLYIGRTVCKSFITFCHHVVLYVLALLFLPIYFGWLSLFSLIGLALLFLNGFWVVGVLAFLSARFRDLEMIVRNLMQVAFFVTPIFWSHTLLAGKRRAIVDWNPFFYFLELVRRPLLGELPPFYFYIVVLAITGLGYALLYLVYRRLRPYLALFV
jgi:ABC-type polysaccharide/polyol phosphate export permease